MHPTPCLNDPQIQRFLSGTLDPSSSAMCEEHLSVCNMCLDAMQMAAGDASWWSDVHSALKSDNFSQQRSDFIAQSLIDLLSPSDEPGVLGTLAEFDVHRLIGYGGMGGVFQAWDRELNRPVAIKVMLPHLSASVSARAKFAREGKAVAAIRDPNVLAIYQVDQYRGNPFLVMQYIEGGSLQQQIHDLGGIPIHRLLEIALDISRALVAAHARGLIHRDIKPSNILVESGSGKAILCDFGLARASEDTAITGTGLLAGTPAFMSPEQVLGGSIDPRSDLFGLGGVLYAMATGHPPFVGSTSYSLLRNVVEAPPRALQEINPLIPTWLAKLISWLLEKDPSTRPSSAQETYQLIQQCLAYQMDPRSHPLPSPLQEPKADWYFLPKRFAMTLISMVLVGGALGFLLSGTPIPGPQGGYTTRQEPQEKPQQQTATGAWLKGSTEVAGYRIELVGIDQLDGSTGVTKFRPKLPKSQPNVANFGTNQTNNFKEQGNSGGGFGSVTSGAGGLTATGGGGVGFGIGFTKPNQGIALKISQTNNGQNPKLGSFAELGSYVKILELNGTFSEAPDMGPISHSWPSFERKFPKCSALYLFRRMDIDAPFREISGELKVTQGRKIIAEFDAIRVQAPLKKKVQDEEFVIQKIHSDANGIYVTALFPMTTASKKINDPIQRMMSMNSEAFELEIEDEQGNILVPTGKSKSGSGGGSFQGFSFNGNTQTRTNRTPEPSSETIQFRFPPTADKYAMKTIRAIFYDETGETQTVPFKISLD